MVVAVGGDAHGAVDGIFLAYAVEAVMVALVLYQIGVSGTWLEELRTEQWSQPPRGASLCRRHLMVEPHGHR